MPTPSTSSQQHYGALMVGAAAIGFSTKAIFIKLAYTHGISPINLMALRMLFALPIYLMVAIHAVQRASNPLTKAEWLKTALLGGCGYYVASILDFAGLQYVSASVERLVLYSYPSMVLVLNRLVFKQRPTRAQWLGTSICYLGITLIVQAEHTAALHPHALFGAALIAASAFAYAVFLVYTPNLLKRLGSTRYNAYGMCFATGFILAHQNLAETTPLFAQPTAVLWLAVGMALFATVLPSFWMMSGMARIGANRAGIIGMIGPASTLLLAALFLGESITLLQIFGTILVMAGIGYQEIAGRWALPKAEAPRR
jgi:drug/metabolite transporter (DMT)-like permease